MRICPKRRMIKKSQLDRGVLRERKFLTILTGRRVMSGFLDDLIRKIQQDARGRLDDEYLAGYNEAANICVDLLSKKIDGLLNQIKSGSYLSEEEQFLLSQLNALKSETERTLHAHLRSE